VKDVLARRVQKKLIHDPKLCSGQFRAHLFYTALACLRELYRSLYVRDYLGAALLGCL
jgi:hypothetical protein